MNPNNINCRSRVDQGPSLTINIVRFGSGVIVNFENVSEDLLKFQSKFIFCVLNLFTALSGAPNRSRNCSLRVSSDQALAATIGSLVEVPVLLALTWMVYLNFLEK
jgi:hypothetical protein